MKFAVSSSQTRIQILTVINYLPTANCYLQTVIVDSDAHAGGSGGCRFDPDDCPNFVRVGEAGSGDLDFPIRAGINLFSEVGDGGREPAGRLEDERAALCDVDALVAGRSSRVVDRFVRYTCELEIGGAMRNRNEISRCVDG